MTPAPKQVLDIGCGCGYHDLMFAQYNNIEKVVGIDYSEQSILRANNEYYNSKINRFSADIFNDTDFDRIKEEGPFDLVCSFQVIEHVSKPVEFIKRCRGLTVEGGYIGIITPNYSLLQNKFNRYTGKPVELIDPLHYAEYTVKDLKDMGKLNGFLVAGWFGHGVTLSVKARTIFKGYRPIDVLFGKLVPYYTNVIGVVFVNR